MRKRSEVKETAEARTESLFKDEPPAPKSAFTSDVPACKTCEKPFTETSLGHFPSCGHKQGLTTPDEFEKKVEAVVTKGAVRIAEALNKDIEKPAERTDEVDLADSVTVVWGEEKYTLIPNSYSTFTVGPFSTTTWVRSGETPKQARARALEDLRAQAEEERERKGKSFVDALKRMMNEARK